MPLLRPTNADYITFLKAAASKPSSGSNAVVKSRASFNVGPQLGVGALVTASHVGNKSSPSSSVLRFGDPVRIPPVVIIPKVLPTGGDLITMSNGRRYHYFTSPTGTYNAGSGYSPVEIMAVGGGGAGGAGGGGAGYMQGGGGAGELAIATYNSLTGSYIVTIGNGGTYTSSSSMTASGNTSIGSILSVPGGGRGARTGVTAGTSGGSGGGGGSAVGFGAASSSGTFSGQSSVSEFTNAGGPAAPGIAGGGGGAGGVGGAPTDMFNQGNGGAGYLYAGTYYAAGGGAGGYTTFGYFPGAGGSGVGGNGSGTDDGGPGAPNTGSGGGGGSLGGSGGVGGSGILIVSYVYP
jgi:hypothetical protein